MARVLILGGAALTQTAAQLAQRAGHEVHIYWSRDPMGDASARCETIRSGLAAADAVVDATHPFDDAVPAIARALAPDLPWLRMARAPWTPTPADRWTTVPGLPAAVAALPAGARVFAASGRDSAETLAHHDGHVFLRQLHHHSDPAPTGCTFVFGNGPFDQEGEQRLFADLAVDVVLARNVGGTGSFPKLAAARALGLPVILIAPPAPVAAPRVETGQDLLAWLAQL